MAAIAFQMAQVIEYARVELARLVGESEARRVQDSAAVEAQSLPVSNQEYILRRLQETRDRVLRGL